MRIDTLSLIDAIRRPDRASAMAIIGPERSLTYGELDDALRRRAGELETQLGLEQRSIVVLTGTNSIEWVVTYLSLLSDGHVPLLASGSVDRLVEQWDPAVVLRTDRHGWIVEGGDASRGTGRSVGAAAVEIHPDLALLMSTSGSTGSPKLVRLSHRNLVANAASIVEFQQLTPDDVGVTNLPLHYSFGLSVLHSHLLAGAGLVVTDRSVVDECFGRALADHGVTNVAGVPHTFDLLEQAGPDRLAVPSLRFLAQAGGKMSAEHTERWAERAREWGASWFTMYGQTEATARISYVPPELARSCAGSIGRPIPGGDLSIRPVDEADAASGVGEIVYTGPNVMLGYAVEPSDLARGRDLEALRTGDLGRFDASTGMFEVVGRLARRIKPFGVRVDLDDVERRLARAGIEATVVGDDERVVAAASGVDPDQVTAGLASITGLPPARCHALDVDPPRRSNGKIDAAALLAAVATTTSDTAADSASEDRLARLAAAYATVLGRDGVDLDATFVSLGGDSLSYVECSIRAEQILGPLPSDWHQRSLRDLAAEPERRRRLPRVDTTVVLRAVGILAVVSTHMRFRHVPGGAHLMLGVVGYNVARFMLPIEVTRDRIRAGFRTVARVAVPTVLWTVAFMAAGQYTWTTLSLLNNYIGPRSHAGNHWHFWFIEVFVHLVLVTTLLMAIPAVRRADRRWPYAFPLVLLGATIALRLDWADMGDWYNLRFRTHAVAWFFVLGWLVQRSSSTPQRVVTTVLCLATAPGVFMNPQREFFIAFGLVLLVWFEEVPLPRMVVRPVATIAAASMWIFISHFMIWPPMKELFIVEVAYPLTVLASLGVWWAMTRLPRLARADLAARLTAARPLRSRASAPALTPM